MTAADPTPQRGQMMFTVLLTSDTDPTAPPEALTVLATSHDDAARIARRLRPGHTLRAVAAATSTAWTWPASATRHHRPAVAVPQTWEGDQA